MSFLLFAVIMVLFFLFFSVPLRGQLDQEYVLLG